MEGFTFHAGCYKYVLFRSKLISTMKTTNIFFSKWIKQKQEEELKSRSTFNPEYVQDGIKMMMMSNTNSFCL